MVCRHSPGDPNCSATARGHVQYAQEQARATAATERERETLAAFSRREQELLARTPDPNVYEVLRFKQVGTWLVVEVQYTSCKKCSFDAKKILVFAKTKVDDMVFWKKIDPHFQAARPMLQKEAPPPRGRFPADTEGWQDALDFASVKSSSHKE